MKKVEVVYPSYAYEEKCEGEVVLAILIKGDGRVEDVKVVKSSDEIFNEAAIKAAKQWLFKPAILNKKPIKFWYNVEIVFMLVKTDSLGANIQPEVVVLGDSSSVIIVLRDSTSTHIAPPQNKAAEVIDINPDEFVPRFGQPQTVDEGPVLIQRVEPKYPPISYVHQNKGVVVLVLLVDTDGRVKDQKILRASNFSFIGHAVRAVKQWVFKPAVLNGNPVKFWFTDSLDFRAK